MGEKEVIPCPQLLPTILEGSQGFSEQIWGTTREFSFSPGRGLHLEMLQGAELAVWGI